MSKVIRYNYTESNRVSRPAAWALCANALCQHGAGIWSVGVEPKGTTFYFPARMRFSGCIRPDSLHTVQLSASHIRRWLAFNYDLNATGDSPYQIWTGVCGCLLISELGSLKLAYQYDSKSTRLGQSTPRVYIIKRMHHHLVSQHSLDTYILDSKIFIPFHSLKDTLSEIPFPCDHKKCYPCHYNRKSFYLIPHTNNSLHLHNYDRIGDIENCKILSRMKQFFSCRSHSSAFAGYKKVDLINLHLFQAY